MTPEQRDKVFVALATAALVVASSLFPAVALAHPGRTASDGCHYCRTNCGKWGVGWDVRHCHGGGAASLIAEPDVEDVFDLVAPPVVTVEERNDVREVPVVDEPITEGKSGSGFGWLVAGIVAASAGFFAYSNRRPRG